MSLEQLSTLDTYKIKHAKVNGKFDIDYTVLIRLYQPVMGSDATSLYLTLCSELSLNKGLKNAFKVDRLTKITGLDINRLNIALNYLNNCNLINVKKSGISADYYLITLNKINTANEFYKNSKFADALEVEVDSTYYQQVYDYFMADNNDDEDDKEFNEIAEVSLNKITTEEDYYNEFAKKYPMVVSSLYLSEIDKKEIRRLVLLYHLSYEMIEKALLDNIQDSKTTPYRIDLNKLNKFIEKEFKNFNKNENEDDIKVRSYESEKVASFYSKIIGRENLLPRESDTIDHFLSQYNITQGYLNLVLEHSYKYLNYKGRICDESVKKYIDKVLLNLSIEGITNTKDVLTYFNSKKSSSQQNQKVFTKVVEVTPVEKSKVEDKSVYDKLRKLMQEDDD